MASLAALATQYNDLAKKVAKQEYHPFGPMTIPEMKWRGCYSEKVLLARIDFLQRALDREKTNKNRKKRK